MIFAIIPIVGMLWVALFYLIWNVVEEIMDIKKHIHDHAFYEGLDKGIQLVTSPAFSVLSDYDHDVGDNTGTKLYLEITKRAKNKRELIYGK